MNKKARREHLDALEGEKRTMIFYEAPHKLCATLRDLAAAFGEDRRLSLSRELTKLHEQTLRMTLGEAMRYFDENPPRGEFVLIVEGAPDEPETEQSEEERLARRRGGCAPPHRAGTDPEGRRKGGIRRGGRKEKRAVPLRAGKRGIIWTGRSFFSLRPPFYVNVHTTNKLKSYNQCNKR